MSGIVLSSEKLLQDSAGWQEFVRKTVDATTADTDYSNLVGVQSQKFFRRSVDQAIMSKMAQTPFVNGAYLELGTVEGSTKMAIGLAETATISGTSDESSVTFAGRRITPVSTRMLLQISQHRLQHMTPERGGINKTLIDILTTEFGNHVEEVCVKSEDGGSDSSGGTGYLTEIDGWRSLAASGNVYDHEGGYLTSALVKEMWNNIPTKWRKNKNEYVLFAPSDAEMSLRDLYAQRATALGDRLMENGAGVTTWMGIPIVFVDYIPTDIDGILTKTGTSDSYTWLMLAQPKNMYIGYRPEVKMHTDTNVEGNILYVSLWAEWAPQFENINAVSVGANVLPDVTY